jgi:RNA polymerase sigma-32 factor
MTLAVTTLSSADSGLTLYLQEIKKYPILSAAEEYILAKAVVEHQDINAAHKLVTSHLKLVVKIASTMRGYGLALMDLIAEGNIGLMHAVKKFNPDLGFRLSTYAMWWIKAAMQEFIIKSWSLVKIGTTIAQKKLFFNLNKIKRKIRSIHGHSNDALTNNDITAVANQLNVSLDEVKEMDIRLKGSDYSLDTPIYNNEGNVTTLLEHIPETGANQETLLSHNEEASIKKKLFNQALSSLNERERDIIKARHLQEVPETLDILSKRYNISRERIRQIETRAMEKLKNFVNA